MKRLLAIILAAFIAASLVTGCGNKEEAPVSQNVATGTKSDVPDYMNESGYPITKEKVTLKMMGSRGAAQGEWNNMEVMKRMEGITNIGFEFNTPLSTGFNEVKSLAFASGDYPDVFYGAQLTINEEETNGSEGILIPLEKYIDKYAPFLKKKLDENPDIRKAITASDGHIYSLPGIAKTKTNASNLLYINMDWLQNVGMSKPQTVDDFYNVLKAFKEKDPNKNGKADEIPLSYWKQTPSPTGTGGILNGVFVAAFGGQAGGNNFDIRNGKVVFNPMESYYKDFLTYMRGLYTDDLLDKEFLLQTQQQYIAKYKTGAMGVSTISLSSVLNPGQAAPYEILPPLTSSVNSKKVTLEPDPVKIGVFALTEKCKYPEAMMRWADVFYREVDDNIEGICGLSNFLGIYKYNWDYADASQKTYKRESKVEGVTPVDYINKYVFPVSFGWVVTDAIPEGDPLLLLKAAESEKNYYPYSVPIYPNTARFTKEESDRVTFLQNDIITYADQMTAKFIFGEESLDKWDTYISTLKKMNIEELLKIKQDAYDRWSKTE